VLREGAVKLNPGCLESLIGSLERVTMLDAVAHPVVDVPQGGEEPGSLESQVQLMSPFGICEVELQRGLEGGVTRGCLIPVFPTRMGGTYWNSCLGC